MRAVAEAGKLPKGTNRMSGVTVETYDAVRELLGAGREQDFFLRARRQAAGIAELLAAGEIGRASCRERVYVLV